MVGVAFCTFSFLLNLDLKTRFLPTFQCNLSNFWPCRSQIPQAFLWSHTAPHLPLHTLPFTSRHPYLNLWFESLPEIRLPLYSFAINEILQAGYLKITPVSCKIHKKSGQAFLQHPSLEDLPVDSWGFWDPQLLSVRQRHFWMTKPAIFIFLEHKCCWCETHVDVTPFLNFNAWLLQIPKKQDFLGYKIVIC